MIAKTWYHSMEAIATLLAPFAGQPPVTIGFPAQKASKANLSWLQFSARICFSTNYWVAGEMRCLNEYHITLMNNWAYYRIIQYDISYIFKANIFSCHIDSLVLNDIIRHHRSKSTLAQVMACCHQVQVIACCLMAPSHYLNQSWLIISHLIIIWR